MKFQDNENVSLSTSQYEANITGLSMEMGENDKTKQVILIRHFKERISGTNQLYKTRKTTRK